MKNVILILILIFIIFTISFANDVNKLNDNGKNVKSNQLNFDSSESNIINFKEKIKMEKANDEIKTESKENSIQCPIKFFKIEENMIIDLNSMFSNDSKLIEILYINANKEKYLINDIHYDGKTVARELRIDQINNANGLDFSNDTDWGQIIKHLNENSVDERPILNHSGETIGYANIYENNVDGFSNEIHIYNNVEDRFINIYWSELSE